MTRNEYARDLLDSASFQAERSAMFADEAIKEIEAQLPKSPPEFGFIQATDGGTNRFPPLAPWTRELIMLRGMLTQLKSARSRARKLGEEFKRLENDERLLG